MEQNVIDRCLKVSAYSESCGRRPKIRLMHSAVSFTRGPAPTRHCLFSVFERISCAAATICRRLTQTVTRRHPRSKDVADFRQRRLSGLDIDLLTLELVRNVTRDRRDNLPANFGVSSTYHFQ